MPRMRTIDQAFAWLQESDPETALTKTALRRMVITGELPGVVRIGSKYLLNLDVLTEYLRGSTLEPVTVEPGIRRIEA